MLSQIDRDKEKINKTLATLDHDKREAVHKTWQKVNTYVLRFFGSASDAHAYAATLARSLQNFSPATSPSSSRRRARI
jgi:hypothetical protein